MHYQHEMDNNRIKEYYNTEIEKNRLGLDHFKLEGIRTKEIISRYLRGTNLNIIDIGGGAGFYSFWLQTSGHHVSLVDLSPKNIELANEEADRSGVNLESCFTGDATQLAFPDNRFDIALLMGPLYHLTQRQARLNALREAKRVLKPGGILIAACISRYASLMDGFRRDLIKDDVFEKILLADLKNGIHINDTQNEEYFTTAFFHTPAEIKDEISESGLIFKKLIAVESAGWVIDNPGEKLKNGHYLNKISKIIELVESNEDLIAMSPHIIGIAVKA
jgi:ubiquinone/menaquinone biosynthesis C-methylase UbiE